MVNCIDFGLKFAPPKYQKIKNSLLRRARMVAQPIERYWLFGLIGKVNALYFWTKAGAEKSVKYNVLTRLAPFAALAANAFLKFISYINGLLGVYLSIRRFFLRSALEKTRNSSRL